MRSFLIGSVILMAISAPVTIPAMAGEHIAIALGPVEFSYDNATAFELDLNTGCLANHCRIFELRVGEPGSEMYSFGF